MPGKYVPETPQEVFDDFTLRFIEEYCIDLNARQAAIRCGVEPKKASAKGSAILRRDDVLEAIDVRLRELSRRSIISSQWVRTKWVEIVERCMQGQEVTEMRLNPATGRSEKTPTGEWKFDANGANKALENLAKHLQMFGDHKTVTIEHELKAFTPEQLANKQRELLEELGALDLTRGADGVYTAQPQEAITDESNSQETPPFQSGSEPQP